MIFLIIVIIAALVFHLLFLVGMTGRKSLIFGVHQFLWHPWTVYKAWVFLYGKPTWKEAVCIFVHDWGYWHCIHMDDERGERHPITGANIALNLFDIKHFALVLLHSRHHAKTIGLDPSDLCWADKLSILYDPKWFYLLRARLSGEIKEYRLKAAQWIPLTEPDGVWFDWIKEKFIKLAEEKKGDAVPYSN